MSKTRTYGFRIRTEKWADHDSVTVHILAREDDSASPINCRGEGEDEIWDAGKKQHGHLFNDLTLRWWRGSYSNTPSLLVGYENSRFGLREAKRAVRTLQKIERLVAKDDEPGALLEAIAKAFGLTFYAREVEHGHGWSYAHSKWQFDTIRDAKRAIREHIEALPRLAKESA